VLFRLIRFPALLLILATVATPSAVVRKNPPKAAPAKPSPAVLKASATVRRWMRNMTLRDEVSQLVFISFHGEFPNTRSREYLKFVRLVRDLKIGGLILNNVANGRVVSKAEPYAVAAFLNRVQKMATVPLMVGGDFERGASMRLEGTTPFPHAMALGATFDPAYSRYEGEVTARESRALGVQWVYYPVADINNNPDNTIINIRSFGENPQDVSAQVKAFIEGAHSDKKNYILTTAKHFPGHGDTNVDTHVNLATIPADRDRLDKLELVPFKAAIEAGVDSVMTAHVAVPAIAPPDLPATLSPAILTGLLRKELNFQGLVITDALQMAGIAKGFNSAEACVRALEAGADTLLMPSDPEAAIRGVMAAVQSGRLTRARIQESVVKILAAKEKLGLDKKRTVNLDGIGDIVNSPEANDKAQEMADHAVTLVRNQGNMIPLASPDHACYVVMQESRTSTAGRVFEDQIRARVGGAALTTIYPSLSRQDIDDALGKFNNCQSYVAAAYANFGTGRTGLAGELPHAMEVLVGTGKPVAMVALGNPYLIRDFPRVSAYLATFSNVAPSEIAAVRALFGEIAIRGHLPISIPGIAAYRDGIQVAPTRALHVSGTAQ